MYRFCLGYRAQYGARLREQLLGFLFSLLSRAPTSSYFSGWREKGRSDNPSQGFSRFVEIPGCDAQHCIVDQPEHQKIAKESNHIRTMLLTKHSRYIQNLVQESRWYDCLSYCVIPCGALVYIQSSLFCDIWSNASDALSALGNS